jgi:hypothetical protein
MVLAKTQAGRLPDYLGVRRQVMVAQVAPAALQEAQEVAVSALQEAPVAKVVQQASQDQPV